MLCHLCFLCTKANSSERLLPKNIQNWYTSRDLTNASGLSFHRFPPDHWNGLLLPICLHQCHKPSNVFSAYQLKQNLSQIMFLSSSKPTQSSHQEKKQMMYSGHNPTHTPRAGSNSSLASAPGVSILEPRHWRLTWGLRVSLTAMLSPINLYLLKLTQIKSQWSLSDQATALNSDTPNTCSLIAYKCPFAGRR